MLALRHSRFSCALASVLLLVPACRTVPPLPPANLQETGWQVRQGQAVWQARRNAPEIAGELLVATHPDGRAFVQFTKTPLPFVVAQTSARGWQIQFVPKNKTYSGRGAPPVRLGWLHLPRCLTGEAPPQPWSWQALENRRWRLENRSTGEALEGYLNP